MDRKRLSSWTKIKYGVGDFGRSSIEFIDFLVRKVLFPMISSFSKCKRDTHVFKLFAIGAYSIRLVIIHSVSIKTNAERNTGLSNDLLLLLISEKLQHIWVFVALVNRI